MVAMELGSPLTIAPLLVRNIVSSAFMLADSSLLSLAEKHKLLQLCRSLIITTFLFVLRALPSLFPSLEFNSDSFLNEPSKKDSNILYYVPSSDDGELTGVRTVGLSFSGDSGIARALSQLLSIANEIPVSSRKYEVVWSLTERIIDDNHRDGAPALRRVNRTVLSAAYARTLCQLEAAFEERALELAEMAAADPNRVSQLPDYRFGRLVRAVLAAREFARARVGMFAGVTVPPKRFGGSAEKLMAELHWLAQKMVACGLADEAVWRWASADNLARLGITAEPRLQSSLVRISAYMFKQGKDMQTDKGDNNKKELYNQMKMQMLHSWLPLLCKAGNGFDTPVLTSAERTELEKVLEQTIEMLEGEEQQEKVLSLWLDHFTHCSSSDWPNLYNAYLHWCDASRKLLLSSNYADA